LTVPFSQLKQLLETMNTWLQWSPALGSFITS